ncbi:hypothetical protein MTO96_011137 [Rhipicephalus appendiculatus]
MLGEELLDSLLRRTIEALVEITSLVERFSLAGCVESAAFFNFRPLVVAMTFGASGSTDAPFGGRPRGRLAAKASLEGPATRSSAAARRFALPAFGGLWLASACFFVMVSSLRVSIPRQPSVPKSSLCSSALAARREAGPRRRLWWDSGESTGLNSQMD